MFLASETNLTLAFGVAAAVLLVLTLLGFFLLARTAAKLHAANVQLSQTERGADHTERRMFNILNSIPVALVETDTSGRFIFANKAAHQLLGRKDAELIGLRFHSATWGITYPDGRVIPPDLLPAARALRGQTVKGFQHQIVNPNTRKRMLVSVTAMPVTNDLGETIGSTAAMVETETLSEPQAAQPDPIATHWVDLSDDVLIALDGEGRVREVNRIAVDLLGRPESEILGRDWFETFLPETERADARARFEALAQGSAASEAPEPLSVLAADGAVQSLVWRRMALRDDQGRLTAVLAAGRPSPEAPPEPAAIEDAAPAEAVVAPARAEDGSEGFAAATDDIVWVADAQTGRLAFVSPGFTRAYGFDLEALRTDLTPWMARVHEDDRAAVQAAYEAAMAGATREVEFRFQAPLGETRVIQDRAFPIRDAEGNVARVGGIARDIMAMRGGEATLRQSLERLQTLVEATPQLVWTCSSAGWCDYISPSWVAFTGAPEARHHGLGWQDAIHPDDRPRVAAAWLTSVKGEDAFDMDYRLRRADGEYRWFRARSAPQRDESGKVARWFGAAADVTEIVEARALLEQRVADRTLDLERSLEERRKTETALAQAQRLETVGRLTGGVAHDFNNLLTVIIGALDMIQRNADKPERVRRLGDAALTAGRRGERLSRQLLAFSRRQEFQVETLDLSKLILGFEPLIRRALGDSVPFEVEAPADLGLVRVDPVQFEAALLNLVVNAKDAVESGGAVSLRAERVQVAQDEFPDLAPGAYLAVQVADTGSGMEPDVLSRALEPFFTTKEVGKGTGLGLAQVYGFARQSEGHVQLRSQPGEGTVVSLYLPLAEAGARVGDSDAPREARPVEQGKTVLLVEDDAGVRDIAEGLLVEMGCRVVVANDGPEALRVLEASPEVDLLLTDMVMPGGMSGVELAEAARRANPDLKVLISSGYSGDQADIAGEHGLAMLRKPYAADSLSQAVRRALA